MTHCQKMAAENSDISKSSLTPMPPALPMAEPPALPSAESPTLSPSDPGFLPYPWPTGLIDLFLRTPGTLCLPLCLSSITWNPSSLNSTHQNTHLPPTHCDAIENCSDEFQ